MTRENREVGAGEIKGAISHGVTHGYSGLFIGSHARPIAACDVIALVEGPFSRSTIDEEETRMVVCIQGVPDPP